MAAAVGMADAAIAPPAPDGPTPGIASAAYTQECACDASTSYYAGNRAFACSVLVVVDLVIIVDVQRARSLFRVCRRYATQ